MQAREGETDLAFSRAAFISISSELAAQRAPNSSSPHLSPGHGEFCVLSLRQRSWSSVGPTVGGQGSQVPPGSCLLSRAPAGTLGLPSPSGERRTCHTPRAGRNQLPLWKHDLLQQVEGTDLGMGIDPRILAYCMWKQVMDLLHSRGERGPGGGSPL